MDAVRQSFDEQKAAWSAERVEHEQQTAAARAEVERLQAEVESSQAAFAESRRQWESQRTDDCKSRSEFAEELAARQGQLDAARSALDEQRAAQDAEAAEREQQITAARAELEAARAEMESAQAALAEERRRWEFEQNESEASQSAAAIQAGARQAELDAARQAFDEQKAAWETQKASAQLGLEERLAGLDALRVDLDTERTELERQLKQCESRGSEMAADQAEADRRMEARQAEIDAQLHTLAECQKEWDDQQSEAQRTFDDRTAELDRRQAELDALSRVLEESKRKQAESCGADATEREMTAVQPAVAETSTESQAALETSESASAIASDEPVAAPDNSTPAKSGAVDLAETLRRTGYNVDMDDHAASSDERPEEKSAGPRSDRRSASITSPARRSQQPAQAPAHEDDSIDDYMSRLLARNRGDSTVPRPAASQACAPVKEPVKAVKEPTSKAIVATPAAKPDQPIGFGPRATAAEKNIDLTAMRQLANLSAKTAINTHDSKRLSVVSRIKLAVSLSAGVAGFVLLVLSFTHGVHLLPMFLAFAAFAVTAYWGGNYIVLTRQLIGKRMSHMHVKAGEETPADAATDAPQQGQDTAAAEQDAKAAEVEAIA